MAFRGTTTTQRTRSSYSRHVADSLAPPPQKRGFAIIWYSSASTRHAGAKTSASSDSFVPDIWTSIPLQPRSAVDGLPPRNGRRRLWATIVMSWRMRRKPMPARQSKANLHNVQLAIMIELTPTHGDGFDLDVALGLDATK